MGHWSLASCLHRGVRYSPGRGLDGVRRSWGWNLSAGCHRGTVLPRCCTLGLRAALGGGVCVGQILCGPGMLIDVLYVWVNITTVPRNAAFNVYSSMVSLCFIPGPSLFCSVKGKMNCVSLFVLPLLNMCEVKHLLDFCSLCFWDVYFFPWIFWCLPHYSVALFIFVHVSTF